MNKSSLLTMFLVTGAAGPGLLVLALGAVGVLVAHPVMVDTLELPPGTLRTRARPCEV